MINTKLSTVLAKLKAELGHDPVITSDDVRLYTLLENKQEWLAGRHDWPQLKDRWTASVSTRFTEVPTVDENGATVTINWDRPVSVFVLEGATWLLLEQGIDAEEFSVQSSPDGDTQEPPSRWQFKPGDITQFEIWPVPSMARDVRFSGQRHVLALRDDFDTFNPEAIVELDSLMLVNAVAADLLARDDVKDASTKAGIAQDRFGTLRATGPKRYKRFSLVGRSNEPKRKIIPIATA